VLAKGVFILRSLRVGGPSLRDRHGLGLGDANEIREDGAAALSRVRFRRERVRNHGREQFCMRPLAGECLGWGLAFHHLASGR
jgi:hypothetical protein